MPDFVLKFYFAYLTTEPSPSERVEIAIAQLTLFYLNVHKKPGAAKPKLKNLLMFIHAWRDKEEVEIEQEIEAMLENLNVGVKDMERLESAGGREL